MAMSAGSKPSLVFFLVFFAHAFCFVLACSKLGNCMFSHINIICSYFAWCVCVCRAPTGNPPRRRLPSDSWFNSTTVLGFPWAAGSRVFPRFSIGRPSGQLWHVWTKWSLTLHTFLHVMDLRAQYAASLPSESVPCICPKRSAESWRW